MNNATPTINTIEDLAVLGSLTIQYLSDIRKWDVTLQRDEGSVLSATGEKISDAVQTIDSIIDDEDAEQAEREAEQAERDFTSGDYAYDIRGFADDYES